MDKKKVRVDSLIGKQTQSDGVIFISQEKVIYLRNIDNDLQATLDLLEQFIQEVKKEDNPSKPEHTIKVEELKERIQRIKEQLES